MVSRNLKSFRLNTTCWKPPKVTADFWQNRSTSRYPKTVLKIVRDRKELIPRCSAREIRTLNPQDLIQKLRKTLLLKLSNQAVKTSQAPRYQRLRRSCRKLSTPTHPVDLLRSPQTTTRCQRYRNRLPPHREHLCTMLVYLLEGLPPHHLGRSSETCVQTQLPLAEHRLTRRGQLALPNHLV